MRLAQVGAVTAAALSLTGGGDQPLVDPQRDRASDKGPGDPGA
jgi:hypothetical protein